MKFKDSITQYLNDLPNRWSANFLALLGGVNFGFLLVIAFIITLYNTLLTSEPTNFIEFIKEFLFGILGYTIFFCFISFILAACIAIPYILMILSKKRSFVMMNMSNILTFFITIFALVTKSVMYKKYVKFFYCYILLIILALLIGGLHFFIT